MKNRTAAVEQDRRSRHVPTMALRHRGAACRARRGVARLTNSAPPAPTSGIIRRKLSAYSFITFSVAPSSACAGTDQGAPAPGDRIGAAAGSRPNARRRPGGRPRARRFRIRRARARAGTDDDPSHRDLLVVGGNVPGRILACKNGWRGVMSATIPRMERGDLVTGAAQSGGRPPADDDLRLVQDFVNMLDRETTMSCSMGPMALPRGWSTRLSRRPGYALRMSARGRAREARRALLLANNGGPDAPDAHGRARGRGRRARLEPAFGPPCCPRRLRARRRARELARGRVHREARRALGAAKAAPATSAAGSSSTARMRTAALVLDVRLGKRVKAGAYDRRRTRGD